MRHTTVLVLTLLVVAPAAGAEKPIPQDLPRMEARRKERLEWQRRTLQGAYDKVGKKSPKWDAKAREALDLAARFFSEQVDPPLSLKDVNKATRAALDAGCDDPLVVYLDTRSLSGPNFPAPKELAARYQASAKALGASRYPAFRRAVVLRYAGSYLLSVAADEPARKEAERHFDAALALLPESAARDERTESWEVSWFHVLTDAIAEYRRLGVEAPAAYKRVDAALAKVPEVKALRLSVRGEFWYDYGVEARGTAIARDVPEEAGRAFVKRLEVAQEAFEEAWKVQPGNALTATRLLMIDQTIGGDRETMELWFDRAMKADGDRYQACAAKLAWLEPKWHGSVDEMLAFGRACRDTKNWRVGLTLLCPEAHYRLVQYMKPADWPKYLKTPEVWSDIQSVFEDYLKHFPQNNVARSKYAYFCYQSGHYPEAHAQFQKLGDTLTEWASSPNVSYEDLKKIRDAVARVAAGKPMIDPAEAATLAGWIKFNARNSGGQWSVAIPVKPERRQEAGILGAKARNVFTATANGVTYTVRIQLAPPDALSGKARAVLAAARDAIAQELGGKPRDEQPVGLGGFPAQEFRVEVPGPKFVRVRLGVVGDRLYELSTSSAKSDGNAETKFLNSFEFQ